MFSRWNPFNLRRRRVRTRPFCIICQPNGQVDEEEEGEELIYPCHCPRQSNLGTFHYECLVGYLIATADKKCPNCNKHFKDRRIKRMKHTRVSNFIDALIHGPSPMPMMEYVYGTLVVSIILFIVGRLIDSTGVRYGFYGGASILLGLFLGLMYCAYICYNIFEASAEPHIILRFSEYGEEGEYPNRVRFFNVTEAQRQFRQDDIEEQLEGALNLQMEGLDELELDQQEQPEHEVDREAPLQMKRNVLRD